MGDGLEPINTTPAASGLPDRYQQLFSVFQIRLVGAILIGHFVIRAALFLALAPALEPFMKLSQLSALANSAILLPLGCALYLLDSGYRRLALEKPLLKVLFPLLLPLSLSVGLLLPGVIVTSTQTLRQQQTDASKASESMLADHQRLERRMASLSSPAAASSFSDAVGVTVPISPEDSMQLVRWRFSQALNQRHVTLLDAQPLARITPYQKELLSVGQMITAVSLSVFSGTSLLLLFVQGRRRFRRYHLSPANFLTAEAVTPRTRGR